MYSEYKGGKALAYCHVSPAPQTHAAAKLAPLMMIPVVIYLRPRTSMQSFASVTSGFPLAGTPSCSAAWCTTS